MERVCDPPFYRYSGLSNLDTSEPDQVSPWLPLSCLKRVPFSHNVPAVPCQLAAHAVRHARPRTDQASPAAAVRTAERWVEVCAERRDETHKVKCSMPPRTQLNRHWRCNPLCSNKDVLALIYHAQSGSAAAWWRPGQGLSASS